MGRAGVRTATPSEIPLITTAPLQTATHGAALLPASEAQHSIAERTLTAIRTRHHVISTDAIEAAARVDDPPSY